MRDFRKLQVWQKSHQFVLTLYQVTQSFPQNESYGLTSQIRRAAASVPTNLAEGCGRNTEAELKRFCEIAMGSASEVEYQLLLAHDLAYLSDDTYTDLNQQIIEVKKMLSRFIKALSK